MDKAMGKISQRNGEWQWSSWRKESLDLLALKMAIMLELHIIIAGRFSLLLQGVNVGFQWPAEGETILCAHVVGTDLTLYRLPNDLAHVSGCGREDLSVLELGTMLAAEVTLRQNWLVWPSDTDVAVVLFYPYLSRLSNLVSVDVTTLMLSGVHA
jgi:hypothetical protein